MQLNKRAIVALAILLTLSYGLSLAAAGVSIPGCGEELSLRRLSVEGSP